MRVKCPVCRRILNVSDLHRPIYCSNCGTLFEVVLNRAFVLDRVELDRGD